MRRVGPADVMAVGEKNFWKKKKGHLERSN
jgi:hypothetical protein